MPVSRRINQRSSDVDIARRVDILDCGTDRCRCGCVGPGLRPQVDVLVVSMHAGIYYLPVVIAMYLRETACHAIGNGADLVLQHHADLINKDVEVYGDNAIYFDLGNFASEHTRHLAGKPNANNAALRSVRELYRVKSAAGQKYDFLVGTIKVI